MGVGHVVWRLLASASLLLRSSHPLQTPRPDHAAATTTAAACVLRTHTPSSIHYHSIPQVLLDTVLHPPRSGPGLSVYESGVNTIFLFVAVCVAYGMVRWCWWCLLCVLRGRARVTES